MKIVAMVGGLGSQIMKYMFFINIKAQKTVINEEFLLDTSSFFFHKMWNGYELERIFHIKEKDIWEGIRDKETVILRGKNYRDVVMQYCYHNINKNVCCYYKKKKINWNEWRDHKYDKEYETKGRLGIVHEYTRKVIWFIKFVLKNLFVRKDYGDLYPEDYLNQPGVTYYDDFCHVSDKYLFKDKKALREIFSFPEFRDQKNKAVSEQMCTVNSVAIHVRRSDHMYDNGSLFRRGYFKNAVNYMKKNIEDPFFYIFSEDISWCKDNLDILGIDEEDSYLIIDWNSGSESYRDMQLMTYCKNNVLVMSSFSWCGYYLSVHDEKIVIAPKGWWLEVPIHM